MADKWSERMIAHALARQVFQGKNLVIVPNCTWTGDELDLLVVTSNLRIIDVEVKISRPDLKADAKKDKWYHSIPYNQHQYRLQCRRLDMPVPPRERREWPRRVWKHYYAIPKELWRTDISDHLKAYAPRSGVILMSATDTGKVFAHVERRSQPNTKAEKISAEDAVCLARLASLRMWDAYAEIDNIKTERG